MTVASLEMSDEPYFFLFCLNRDKESCLKVGHITSLSLYNCSLKGSNMANFLFSQLGNYFSPVRKVIFDAFLRRKASLRHLK